MRVAQSEDLLAGRAIVAIAALLVLIVIGTCFGVARMLGTREHALRPSGAFPDRNLPRPTERSAIEQQSFRHESDLQRQRRDKAAILDSYGWVDRERGIVRIPIARAIELYVAEAGGP